jgi:hypothetical protein
VLAARSEFDAPGSGFAAALDIMTLRGWAELMAESMNGHR